MKRILLLLSLAGFLSLSAQTPQVSLYPNPAAGQVNISFTETVKTDVVITISDILGNKIETLKFSPESTISIDLASLSLKSGIYLVKIESGELSILKRLVVKV